MFLNIIILRYNMKLLNLSEHRSCFNYQLNFASGFTRYKLAAQEWGKLIMTAVFVFYSC